MSTFVKLRDQLEHHLDAAKIISRKAEDAGRDFTPAEQEEVEQHLDAAKALGPQVRMAKADEKMTAKLRALGPDVDGDLATSGYGGHSTSGDYKAGGASQWAEGVARQLTKAAHAAGTKDISASQLGVPAVVEPAVQIPTRPNRLLDLIPTRTLQANTFSYAKQVAAINNATVVPDHAVKPTSTYTFVDTEDRARVIAHVTAPIALRVLADHDDLIRVIDQQMYMHLREELEDQISAGDGVGENFTGLLHTSGTLATGYATSLPATLRAARLQLETSNTVPTAWVMSPTDLAALDLLVDGQNRFYGPEIISGLMGGLAKVSSMAIPPGVAILGDFANASRLYVREEALLSIDTAGELFRKNEAVLRYEGRWAFACLRPAAFTVVSLTP